MALAGPMTHLPLIGLLFIIIAATHNFPYVFKKVLPLENTFGTLMLIDLFTM